MTDNPFWMPFHTADYTKDTRHISTLEHGAYLMLMIAAWDGGGKVPTDPSRLLRITGLTADQWKESGSTLIAFFYRRGKFYRHKRIDQELLKSARLIDQKRRAGKASAAKRLANGDGTSVATERQREANQLQLQDTLSNDKGAADAAKELFSEGVELLVSTGSSVGAARSFLGKCRKTHGDSKTLNMVREARRQQISEPRAWITQALARSPSNDADALIASVARTYGTEAMQ